MPRNILDRVNAQAALQAGETNILDRVNEQAAASSPTEESINITRKFLGGEKPSPRDLPGGGQTSPPVSSVSPLQQSRLPAQAAPIAGQRAFGQQARRRGAPVSPNASLSSRFFDLPGPVGFSQTPQGQAILQRILGSRGGRRRF